MMAAHETGLLYDISVWIVPVLIAIPLHEAAHGFAALMFGDDTAKRAGRLTANPLRHVDLFGTLILPAMLLLASGGTTAFGWAKPVPVAFGRLTPLRLGMVVVALAGPLTNLVLAFLSLVLLRISDSGPVAWQGWLGDTLIRSFQLNLILAVFNMLPLPPLDGGRVAVGILPQVLAEPLARMERYGMLILLLLLFVLPTVANIDVLSAIVLGPARALGELLAQLAGII